MFERGLGDFRRGKGYKDIFGFIFFIILYRVGGKYKEGVRYYIFDLK